MSDVSTFYGWCRDTDISHQVNWIGQQWVTKCGANLTGFKHANPSGWDDRPVVGIPCPDCYQRRPLLCPKLCGIEECERNGCAVAALKEPGDVTPVTPLLLLDKVKAEFECVYCHPDNCIQQEPSAQCPPGRFFLRAIELLQEQASVKTPEEQQS